MFKQPTPCRSAILVVPALLLCLAPCRAEDDPGKKLSVSAAADSTLLAPSILEARHATIGEIRIINENVFDPANPEERGALYRLANTLHVRTRPEVVYSQLLFEPGDPYSQRLTEETERLLRANRYLRDAEIEPREYDDGVVDIDVRTTDVWTLSPSVSFGRGGGKNSGGIGLKEHNLLGSGSEIGISYKSDVDHDATAFRYADGNLFGSHVELAAGYAHNSDGFEQQFDLQQPFYALETAQAWGAQVQSGRRIEPLYDRGDVAGRFDHSFDHYKFFYGWSSGLRSQWVKRFTTGLAYDDHRFDAVSADLLPLAETPESRKFIYPFLGFEIVQDDFVESRNLDQIDRVEDRHLGMRFSAQVGYAGQSWGSSDDAWIVRSNFHNSLLRTKKSTIVFDADLGGRIESGAARNMQLSLSSRYDRRLTKHQLFHAGVVASVGTHLDLDNPLYLGGDSGLRGYPLRYLGGDTSVLLTVEQRIFTDWYPFRLFNVGGAVFADAGRTWGANPAGGPALGWLRDVGFGLRIGNSRSSVGRMIHIDLAFPLDGEADISSVQLLVEAKKGF